MMSTKCVVPTTAISCCFGSSILISLLYAVPTCLRRSKSAGLFILPVKLENLATMALTFLFRRTVPVPPLPACLYLTILRDESYHEKFRHPNLVCSAPEPAETTETLRLFSPPYFSVRISVSRCVSDGNPSPSSITTFPLSPSINIITSDFAFPCISSASHPANLRYGPKYPPTLESMIESVRGEIATTMVFPLPGYIGVPPRGPHAMHIVFSESSHLTLRSLGKAFHRSQRLKPRPPMNVSFMN